MKRKALLLGTTRGLQGVQLDIHRFSKFLISDRGGAWYRDEIEVMENPAKNDLQQKIARLRSESLDYLVVMFSGHGAHARTTQLELNRRGELIGEQELQRIATRQLNIYDCCRELMEESMTKAAVLEAYAHVFDSARSVRQVYEKRIMQATPQQASLYSCSVGESSYDSAEGAHYLSALLAATKAIPAGDQFLTVGEAHEIAREKTRKQQRDQNPDASLSKCVIAQQLILAMDV